jgi:hypothetical protein
VNAKGAEIMKKIVGVVLVIVCSTFWGTVALSAPNIQDGMWEITSAVEMNGMPSGMMKPMTHTTCLNQKDSVPDKPVKSDCKMTDMKSEGNTVSWTVTCPDSVSKGKITYAVSTFDGTMETTMNHGGKPMQMKSKMKGKRIGPCTK